MYQLRAALARNGPGRLGLSRQPVLTTPPLLTAVIVCRFSGRSVWPLPSRFSAVSRSFLLVTNRLFDRYGIETAVVTLDDVRGAEVRLEG